MARDTFDIQTASISTRVDDARLRYYVSPELRRLIFNDKLQTGEKGLNRWIQDSPDDAKKNPKVDVYSLTIIIVELLFGTTLCSKIQSIDNSLTTAGDYQGNEIKFYRDICAAIDRKGVAEMFDEMVTEQEEINRNQKRTLIDLIKSGVQIDPRERCSMEDLSNKWKGFRKTIMRE